IGRPELDRIRENVGTLIAQLPVVRFCCTRLWEMRALVCDGETFLAWVGALQDHPFSAEQRAAFGAVLQDLRRRLAFDLLLEQAPVTVAALDTMSEVMGAVAFVFDEDGYIHHANAAGRCWAAQNRDALSALLAERPRGGADASFSVTRMATPGRPLYLAIGRRPSALPARAAASARRWQLTPRQTQVLTLLAGGKANKEIAAELSCALHTVEVHVAALLDKARCSSRSELTARLWST
ncbi:MAG: response regulator transcription factor, partial [Myxococcales bacterium]